MMKEGFAVEVLEGGTDKQWLMWALAATQGRRPEMEDAHAVSLDLEGGRSDGKQSTKTALFGVFDGHGGREVAAFCARHLPSQLVRTSSFTSGDLATALYEAFIALDEAMKDPANQAELCSMRQDMPLPGDAGAREQQRLAQMVVQSGSLSKAGSTAVVALVRPGQLVVGHVGDSRCLVVCRDGNMLMCTRDHKPMVPDEAQRIYSAGGFVTTKRPGGTPRVGGTLALSRAFGDMRYKGNAALPPEEQIVTSAPDTTEIRISDDCEFMVLACDGVWDVLTTEQVTSVVQPRLRAGEPLGYIAQKVVEYCLDHQHGLGPSQDNITAMIVVFGDQTKLESTGS